MSTKIEPQEKKPSHWTEQMKLILAIIGVVSPLVAIATFLGYKPEKRKSLEWTYVAKGTLVNPTIGPVEKIKVTFDGREIKQLTTVAGRLTNTGDIPITEDHKDIERPPELRFDAAMTKIINADITDRNNARGQPLPNLKARCVVEGDTLRIEHGLLNPGDSLSIQILLEGDPGDVNQLPPISYRISDIMEPSTKYPSARLLQSRVAYLSLSRPWEYVLVGMASLLPPLLIYLSIWILIQVVRQAFPSRKDQTTALLKIQNALNFDSLFRRVTTKLDGTAAALLETLRNVTTNWGEPNWLSDRSLIENAIPQDPVPAELQQQGLTPAIFADRVYRALRHALPQAAGESLWYALPSPYDHRVRMTVDRLSIADGESADDFIGRVRNVAETMVQQPTISQRLNSIEKSNVLFSFATFVFGTVSGLVLAGSWHLLLRAGQ